MTEQIALFTSNGSQFIKVSDLENIIQEKFNAGGLNAEYVARMEILLEIQNRIAHTRQTCATLEIAGELSLTGGSRKVGQEESDE